jgi:hypothetical protein
MLRLALVSLVLADAPKGPTLADDLEALQGAWAQKSGPSETRITFTPRALRVVVVRRFAGAAGRGADVTVTALGCQGVEKDGKRSLALSGAGGRPSGSLTYRLEGDKLTLTGSGRAIDGRLYTFAGPWHRPKAIVRRNGRPVPKDHVEGPSADIAAGLLEGLGYSVPEAGPTASVDLSSLGLEPYCLMDLLCKHPKTGSEVFLRLEVSGKSAEGMRQYATCYYVAVRDDPEGRKALTALAGKIDPRLAAALNEAAAEWEKDKKKTVSRELGGMGARVNHLGLAVFTLPQPHRDATGPVGFGRGLDRP